MSVRPGSGARAEEAVATWLATAGRPVARCEPLQEEGQRAVYRLSAAGPDGEDVIAKRSCAADADIELAVYERVLPRVPIASVRFFTSAPGSAGSTWLFLGDAGGRPFDASQPRDHELAGAALAALHVAGSAPARAVGLRDRGPTAFRGLLDIAVDTLGRAVVENPAMRGDERRCLDDVRARCVRLLDVWGELEEVAADFPQTLVHGDFKEDNLRVVEHDSAPGVVLFDWHEAGLGAPALDLAKLLGYSIAPDLLAYERGVRAAWPHVDRDAILRMGYVGEAMRCVASIRWESEQLFHEWLATPISRFRVYARWLYEVLAARPWATPWSIVSVPEHACIPRTWH